MSRVRQRRSARAHLDDGDETVGLAGWMYTDMLLGLVVVFLGSISVIVPARVLANEPDGEVGSVSTTTTTTIPVPTTTTVEVAQCPRLYISKAGRKTPANGIWLVFPNDLGGAELGASFDQQLMTQLAEEPELQEYLANNPTPSIGLALGSGWYDVNTEGPGVGEDRAKQLLDRLVAIRPLDFESTILRAGGRKSVTTRSVGIEIYPIVEGSCS